MNFYRINVERRSSSLQRTSARLLRRQIVRINYFLAPSFSFPASSPRSLSLSLAAQLPYIYHAFSLFPAADAPPWKSYVYLSRAPRDFLYFHTTRRAATCARAPALSRSPVRSFERRIRYRIHYITRYIDTPVGVHSHGAALIVRG